MRSLPGGRRSIAGSRLHCYRVVLEILGGMKWSVPDIYHGARPLASRFGSETCRKTPRPQVRPQAKISHPDGCDKITDFHWILIGRGERI